MAASSLHGNNRQSPSSSIWLWIRKNRAGYLFILPALLLYLFFFIYPFISSIYLSMTDWNGVDPKKSFIGLKNYIDMASDSLMWRSFSHNIVWVIIGTISPIVIGLLLGVLLSGKNTRGRTVFRTIFFMPVVLSPVVIGIIWGWIYNPIFGILNRLLEVIGLGFLSRGWLGDPHLALLAVLIAAIWAYFGFCLVVIMAGLQNVDIELYDAAKIDGANSWQQFTNVTIPQLSPVLTMITAYTLIGGFNVFDIVFIMTQGGPANTTELIATYTYKQAFQLNEVGYGAALSMVMTVVSLIASYVFLKVRERNEA
jgi:ABC-type sugar transport system permease subunit